MFSAKTTTTFNHPSFMAALCGQDASYLFIVQAPESAPPPALHLEDMQADIDKMITSDAYRFTDQSCVFLHTDELESEGHCALVNVIEKGWLTRARTRVEFFKVLKTAVLNRFRSVLQQHRLTQKRTGIKPPPRNERRINFESYRPNEISLDDPDAHLQVGDMRHDPEDIGDEMDAEELRRHIMERCNWFERAVLTQLTDPDLDALVLAQLDGMIGKRPDRVKIIITNLHRVQAATGPDEKPYFPLEVFEKAVLQIQTITELVMEQSIEDLRYQQAVARLAEIFNLQIPKSVKPMIIRRLLTIAARDNWQLVNTDVEDLLATVGAAVPKFNKDSMSCLGVLYQAGDKRCDSCGVNVSCAAQSANLGLTEITIQPKLLGAKLNRIPFILPNRRRDEPPPTGNIRDMEIVSYLCNQSRFRQVTHQGETYFQPIDFPDKEKLLFCIGARSIPFRLRFCNPVIGLRKKLVNVNKSYYVPDQMPAAEVIGLINEHAKMAYA